MSVENNISKRALDTLALKSPLNGLMFEVMPKIHHPEFNPSGALNLGLAHNDLLAEKVFEKSRSCLELFPNDVNYGAPEGSLQFRTLMVDFFTRYFHPHYSLSPNEIFGQTGAGASVNQLIMNIADPGDYCMVPSPYYGAFDLDISISTGVHVLPIFLHDEDLKSMSVDINTLESLYEKTVKENKRVTSLLITNPENPMGRAYSRQDLITFMEFGSKHNIHVVFDEIYALSTFTHIADKNAKDPFMSALSIPYKEYIDPSLVHIVYGMSKDFALNGFRIGIIIDQFNEPLRQSLVRISAFSYINTFTDRLFCNLFSDKKWIDEYLLENRCALAESYSRTTEFLTLHNIDYLVAEAGPFMMIDLGPHFNESSSFEYEKTLMHRMLDQGVYLAPGFAFHTHRPGFFRLTFALPWNELHAGLNKLLKAIK